MRPGAEFRAHLRDPLELGQTLVATAGTAARLVITAKENAADGTPRYHIAIIGLHLGLAGELPVKPEPSIVDRVAAGMPIAATTLAAIGYDEGKVRVAVPLPFKLSNEAPIGAYTPSPLRTAAPLLPRRRPSPRPTPTATTTPTAGAPQPTSTPQPASTSSALPTDAPAPAGSALPSAQPLPSPSG